MTKLPKAVFEWLSKIGTKGGKVTSPAKAATNVEPMTRLRFPCVLPIGSPFWL